MTKKNLKLIMELIFIFIIPLVILCINCNYQNTIEYDNNGNYQATEKHIEFNAPFTYTNGYKNTINNFNLFDGLSENGEWEVNGKVTSPIRACATNLIPCLPNTKYYYYDSSDTRVYMNFRFYDSSLQNIENQSIAKNTTFTSPNDAYYIGMFTGQESYGINSFNSDININLSVSWANGNYVPYGEPLIIYSETDISGQNDVFYTIWGNLKNLIIDNLQIQDNQIVDIIITYTILWFIMFIIWHFFYLLFDGLVHIFIDWGHKEKEKVK